MKTFKHRIRIYILLQFMIGKKIENEYFYGNKYGNSNCRIHSKLNCFERKKNST